MASKNSNTSANNTKEENPNIETPKTDEEKIFRLYDKGTKEWNEVSEEIFRDITRETDAYIHKMKRAQKCGCTHDKRLLCDKDCETCKFKKQTDVPLDKVSILTASMEMSIVNKIFIEELCAEADRIVKGGGKIFFAMLDFKSQAKAAAYIGIPCSTFKTHWKMIQDNFAQKGRDYYL